MSKFALLFHIFSFLNTIYPLYPAFQIFIQYIFSIIQSVFKYLINSVCPHPLTRPQIKPELLTIAAERLP